MAMWRRASSLLRTLSSLRSTPKPQPSSYSFAAASSGATSSPAPIRPVGLFSRHFSAESGDVRELYTVYAIVPDPFCRDRETIESWRRSCLSAGMAGSDGQVQLIHSGDSGFVARLSREELNAIVKESWFAGVVRGDRLTGSDDTEEKSGDGRENYIVYVSETDQFSTESETIESWHRSFFPTGMDGSDDQPQLICSYDFGFVARLSREELKAMEKKEGFGVAIRDEPIQLFNNP